MRRFWGRLRLVRCVALVALAAVPLACAGGGGGKRGPVNAVSVSSYQAGRSKAPHVFVLKCQPSLLYLWARSNAAHTHYAFQMFDVDDPSASLFGYAHRESLVGKRMIREFQDGGERRLKLEVQSDDPGEGVVDILQVLPLD